MSAPRWARDKAQALARSAEIPGRSGCDHARHTLRQRPTPALQQTIAAYIRAGGCPHVAAGAKRRACRGPSSRTGCRAARSPQAAARLTGLRTRRSRKPRGPGRGSGRRDCGVQGPSARLAALRPRQGVDGQSRLDGQRQGGHGSPGGPGQPDAEPGHASAAGRSRLLAPARSRFPRPGPLLWPTALAEAEVKATETDWTDPVPPGSAVPSRSDPFCVREVP